jgi:DNA-binding MarR family transcriptional regulator
MPTAAAAVGPPRARLRRQRRPRRGADAVTEAGAPRPRRRFDSPQQEAFLSLWRTYDRLRAHEDELFGRHELTAQQYNALRVLRAAHPGKLPTLALGGRLVSRAPDITRLLDRLAERGLVDRERPAGNRRTVHVGITAAGLTLLDDISDDVRSCHERQLGHLSPGELRTLVELLRKARAPHEREDSSWR